MLHAILLLPERALAASFRTDDRAYRIAFVFLLTVLAGWTGLLVFIGPIDLVVTPHDITFVMDGAWRIVNGQVPHNDFYCALGPAIPYLLGLGMALSGPNVHSVVFPLLAFGLGLGISAWITSRRRLGAPLAVLMSLTVFSTAIGLTPLGWDTWETDYAMFYNRMGYAVLMVLAAACFVRQRIGTAEPFTRATSFFAGLGLAFLLLVKISYFILAVPMVVFAPLFLGGPRKWYSWSVLGFASLVSLFWLVLRVHPASFFRDMWMVLKVAHDSQSPVLPQIAALGSKLWLDLADFAIVFAAALWIRRGHLQSVWRFTLPVAFLVSSDLLLGISNCQLPVAVLLPAEVLILFELALRRDSGEGLLASEDRSGLRISLNWVLLAVGLVLGTQRIAVELLSTKCALKARLARGSTGYPGQQIDAAPFKEVFVPPLRKRLSRYPQLLNLGLELVRKHVTKQSRLVAMEYTNPFNIALGLKPAKGEAWAWHEGKTFSPQTHLAPEQVFAEADFVVRSRRWADVLWPIYGPYVERNFQLVETNQAWALYRRPQPK